MGSIGRLVKTLIRYRVECTSTGECGSHKRTVIGDTPVSTPLNPVPLDDFFDETQNEFLNEFANDPAFKD